MKDQEFIKIGLIGHPVAQSKSPYLHNGWLKDHNLNGEYKAINCPPDHVQTTVTGLINEGYRGFNVTVPHKQAIIRYCDDIDDLAKAVGAVNTVIIKGRKLYGTNTDVFGFIQNIRENAPDFDFTRGTAVLLGAGGAARAAVHGLLAAGVPEITIVNRTLDNAENLKNTCADPARVKIAHWEDRAKALEECSLLVNTTALGMEGFPPLGMPLDFLPASAVVNDIVYKPLMTNLLQAAKARGNIVVTGIDMLRHQARLAFELWTGHLPRP